MASDEKLNKIYKNSKTIAIIGLSSDSRKPSFQVAEYLQQQDFRIIPINPKYSRVLNEKCYPDLISAQYDLAPRRIDIVDIFRRPEFVSSHVDEAIKIGAQVIWMQEGIENVEAAARAKAKGLTVIMNSCLMKAHRRLNQVSNQQYA